MKRHKIKIFSFCKLQKFNAKQSILSLIQFNIIKLYTQLMGNLADNRVNLLAKNWVQINSDTYKNTITEELINSYNLEAHNEEEFAYNNSLLIKRAAINHSNVLKLIYFYQEQQTIMVCNNKRYKHKIYTEHASCTLASLIGVERSEVDICHCCSVMSGIRCLVEKYGYFGVSPTMVFMVDTVGLSRLDQKKTAKVWINEDLRINYSEQICNQEEMCFHLFQLFQLLVQRDLCSKIDVNEMNNQRKFKDFFQYIFKTHKKEPSQAKVQRKRVISQLNGFQTNKIQKNVDFAKPISTNNHLTIKNTNTFPTNNSIRQSLMHIVNSSSNQLDTSYQNTSMKKDRFAVKEVDLHNRSFQKIEKNKVNFSYSDSLATPKNNKSFNEVKTAKLVQSPRQELASVYFRSNKQPGHVYKLPVKRQSFPSISFFACNPKLQTLKIKPLIEKSPQLNPKNTLKQSQQVVIFKKSEIKESIDLKELETKMNLQNLSAQPALKENFSESKVKKQSNLKLQKYIDLQCKEPVLQSSKKSISSIKHSAFQIANEYCFNIEPKIKIPSIGIDHSEQFVTESVEFSSGENLKGKNIYKENPLQKEESASSEHVRINATNLVCPNLREGCSRQGSFPVTQNTLDKKYNSSLHKLQDFSKGIVNSINSNHTKRSLPEENYEVHSRNENLLRANMGDRDYLGNQNKREIRNIRSSDIDSYYSQSESLDQRKKVQILQKISNTQKILEQNKKKLEKLQLEKDLQIQKDMIKRQMESLLKNNMMVDDSHRIKQRVKHKKATFAQLKAEAAKILNDLNL